MTRKYEGVLEIDERRGVIYFHLTNGADIEKLETQTPLRICNLPKPIPEASLDITHMYGADWIGKMDWDDQQIAVMKSTERATFRAAHKTKRK